MRWTLLADSCQRRLWRLQWKRWHPDCENFDATRLPEVPPNNHIKGRQWALIAISVLFLFYVLSFTLIFTKDQCMHFNKAMLVWGRQEWQIYSGVVQRPTLQWQDANTPAGVTLWLQPASGSLFLRPFDVDDVENKNHRWQTCKLGWLLIPNMYHLHNNNNSLLSLNVKSLLLNTSTWDVFEQRIVALKNAILKALLV